MAESYLFEGDEHAALREQTRRFARERIAPHSAAWEEAEEFPAELYGQAGQAGAPKLLAGSGSDQTHLVVVATADRGLCGGFNATIARARKQCLFSGTEEADRELLKSIPGVAEVCSVQLLALLRSRDFTSARECAAFIGVVPMNQSSNEKNGCSRGTATLVRPV